MRTSWSGVSCCIALLAASATTPTVAQVAPARAVPGDSVAVAPNPAYAAGPFKRWIFGANYRDTWQVPVRMPVLDIHRYSGGLTPLKKGGFGQTTSLHMVDSAGVRHVFRSLDKDPTRHLDPDLKETFVADIIRDQISAQHPYASLIVPRLLRAVGILHAPPSLYVMPDDPALGEFRAEFAGLVGAIEERPDEAPDGGPGFAGADKVKSSDGMYDDLEDSPLERVDPISFLTARLMDIYLGDRDRHFDQWRWARMDRPDGRRRWLPIPKDRDQAFRVSEGLMMAITRIYMRKYVSFSRDYPDVEGASYNGRELDRRLLSGLSRTDWDSVAAVVQSRLTDDVIETAVADLPDEVYRKDGRYFIDALKNRRDRLPELAMDYYELLARYVDLHSTDEDDQVEITRWPDGSVRVLVVDDTGHVYWDRTFLPGETEEIRVLTHGGKDRIVIRGRASESIKIRVLPGGNDDVVIDEGESDAPTLVYDDRGDNEIHHGPDTRFDDREPERRHPDELFRPPSPENQEARDAQNWGRYWYPLAFVSYSPDVGGMIGGGAYQVRHGWRKHPHMFVWRTTAQFATSLKGKVASSLSVPQLTPSVAATLDGHWSGIEFVRFYGFGNESEPGRMYSGLGSETSDLGSDFYRVRHEEILFSADLALAVGKRMTLHAGPALKYVKMRPESGNLLDMFTFPGSDDGLFLPGLAAGIRWDSRDNPAAAARGLHAEIRGEMVPAILGVDREGQGGDLAPIAERDSYGTISGVLSAYLSTGNAARSPVLALRLGASKMFGAFPFYEAAFLGGPDNVRGFRENRFAGEALAFGNAELRTKVADVDLILPWEVGLHGLADVGRVWHEGDSEGEDAIHSAFGGGVWLSVLRRSQVISFSVASSEEETLFYARAGFHF